MAAASPVQGNQIIREADIRINRIPAVVVDIPQTDLRPIQIISRDLPSPARQRGMTNPFRTMIFRFNDFYHIEDASRRYLL